MKIPSKLHKPINKAFPATPTLVATVLPNGFAQITLRGSTLAYDDPHISIWERGKGSTNTSLHDGSKVTILLRNPALRESGLLPLGGVARLYGTAKIYKSGPVYEEVWNRTVQPEKDRDPDKKGFAVLVEIERVEDLAGQPIVD